MLALLTFSLGLLGCHLAVASPVSTDTDRSLVPRALPGDAPYTQSAATYEAAITCPNGIKSAPGGVVLLVHGAAQNGNSSWSQGPYVKLLPYEGKGYDVCWVDEPFFNLADQQLSSEYVAYAISYLAARSPGSGNKINLIGHSAGATNPQWTFEFWPSLRSQVINYVALASAFRGTIISNVICLARLGCQPATFQVRKGARWLAALNSNRDENSGAQALVQTTSIYSITDDLIQPEAIDPASFLNGASNIALQSLDLCGPLHVVDHFGQLFDPAPYGLALQALTSGKPATAASFNRAYCSSFPNHPGQTFAGLVNDVDANVVAVLTMLGTPILPQEPTLQPYVCARGYATECGPAGFPARYV